MTEPRTAAGRAVNRIDSVWTEDGPEHLCTYCEEYKHSPRGEQRCETCRAEARAAALDEARAAVQGAIFDLPIGISVDYSRGYSAAVAENRHSLLAAIDALREGKRCLHNGDECRVESCACECHNVADLMPSRSHP